MIPKSYISIQVTKSVKLPNDLKLSQNAKQQFIKQKQSTWMGILSKYYLICLTLYNRLYQINYLLFTLYRLGTELENVILGYVNNVFIMLYWQTTESQYSMSQ